MIIRGEKGDEPFHLVELGLGQQLPHEGLASFHGHLLPA